MKKVIYYLNALVFVFALTALQKTYSIHVVGYFPSWGSYNVNNIQYDKFSHINYAFITPTTSGGLSSVDATRLTTLVTLAHANDVKVLIAIGGATNGSNGFSTIAPSQTLRTTFTVNLLNFIDTYNLDGVDMDWEFPSSGESANYTLMMQELADSLHDRGKLLTAAVAAWGMYGDVIPTEVFDYVDFLNLMAYDAGTPHSTYACALSSIAYWQGRGLTKEKTVLGVPFYGRTPYKSYAALVAQDPLAPYKDNVGAIHYNGLQTIRNKTNLAIDECAGIMIWEITQDSNVPEYSLLNAIHEIIVLSTDDAAAQKGGFQIYPNPSSNDVTINYTSPTSSEVQVTISNILGNELIKQSYSMAGGELIKQINIESLPSGAYLMKVEAGEKIMVNRFTVK